MGSNSHAFHSQMKVRVHKLIVEFKTIRKGNKYVLKYVLCIRELTYSLLVGGDPISESDQMDVLLQGLPEEYNMFIIMIYGKVETNDTYEVEASLYVEEAQMEKYKQDLTTSSATTNITHPRPNQFASRNVGRYGSYHHQRGRARGFNGKGIGRQQFTLGNMPTCQLYNKYEHSIMECWHIFD